MVQGLKDPEAKRKAIGAGFIEVFNDYAKGFDRKPRFLVQVCTHSVFLSQSSFASCHTCKTAMCSTHSSIRSSALPGNGCILLFETCQLCQGISLSVDVVRGGAQSAWAYMRLWVQGTLYPVVIGQERR